jgi:hypothetical protein
MAAVPEEQAYLIGPGSATASDQRRYGNKCLGYRVIGLWEQIIGASGAERVAARRLPRFFIARASIRGSLEAGFNHGANSSSSKPNKSKLKALNARVSGCVRARDRQKFNLVKNRVSCIRLNAFSTV